MKKNKFLKGHAYDHQQFKKWYLTGILTVFILLSQSFQVAKAQGGKLNLNLKNATILDVFDAIKKQTDLTVVYNVNDVNPNLKVSVKAVDELVPSVLNRVLTGTNISYVLEDKHIVLSASKMTAKEQSANVKGCVKDEKGETLLGVSVRVKGTQSATITDPDGRYTLNNVEANSVIVFSYLGYTSQEIALAGRKILDIVLHEDSKNLEEVVVTALGIRKNEKTLSYSAQKISGEDMSKVKSSNFVSALSGKVAGLSINQSASGAGGSSKVILRGQKSISGSSAPLYVIDGIPMVNTTGNQPNDLFGSRDGGDGLSQINPDDIENISVLKGAAASALYGSQGANGVILITTKRGQAGVTKINFSTSTMFSSAIETPKLQWDYAAVPTSESSWGAKSSTPYNDNVKDFYRTGSNLINSLTLSSGTDKLQTYLSYANTHQAGILPTNDFDKHNFTVAQTTKCFNNKLVVDANLNLTNQVTKNAPFMGQYFNPITGLYLFPRGLDFNSYKSSFETFDPIRNLMSQNWYNTSSDMYQNPYWILNRNQSEQKTNRLIGSLKASYEIAKGLNFQIRGNYDYANTKYTQKIYATTSTVLAAPSGRFNYSNLNNTSMYSDAILTYNKSFSNFDFSAVVGSSYQKEILGEGESGDSDKDGLWVTNLFAVNNFNTSKGVRISSELSSKRVRQSVFTNMELGYKKMLYLNATLRNDWSSTLAYTSAEKSGYLYPSVGLAAIVSEMTKLPDFISFAKVRGTFAMVGNDVPYGLTAPGNVVTSKTGFSPLNTEPFTTLKPEMEYDKEIGLDLRMFKGRVGIDAAFYVIDNKDQFLNIPAAASSAYSSYYINAGHIQNKGFELTLLLVPIKTKDMSWNSSMSFSTNSNKVIALSDKIPNQSITLSSTSGYRSYIKEGESWGNVEATDFTRDANGKIILDAKGLPTKTWLKQGNFMPKWKMGWSNTFSYKKFDLSFMIDGKFNYKVFSGTQMILDFYGVSKATGDARNAGGVMIPGYTTLTDAKAYYTRVGGSEGFGAPYVYDGTNIRLSQLSVSYTLSFKNFFVKTAKIALVGSNLFFLYKDCPADPDLSMSTNNQLQGVEYFSLPSTRSFGVNMNFNF
jgi:TonB-linked SusC/RagA family outer membrane protein